MSLMMASGRRVVRLRVLDEFTAADDTAITSLSPVWTKHTSSTNTAAPSVASNRIRNENASTISVYYRDDIVPASSSYTVRSTVVKRTATAGFSSGVVGRLDTAAATYYMFRYQTAANIWELYKTITGSSTLLGSVAQAITIDQAYAIELKMFGSRISGLVDGVPVIAVTDTAITGAGRAGVRLQASMTNTTGVHLDNWQVWE